MLDNLKNPDLFSNIFIKKSTPITLPTFSQIESLKGKKKGDLKVPIVYRQTSTKSIPSNTLGKVELMTPKEFKTLSKKEQKEFDPISPSEGLEKISKSLAVRGAALTTKGFSPSGGIKNFIKSPYQIAAGYALEAASAVPEVLSFVSKSSEIASQKSQKKAKFNGVEYREELKQPDLFKGDISKKAEVEALKNIGFIAGAEAIKPISTFVKSSKFKYGTIVQKPVFKGTVYSRPDIRGVTVSEYETVKPQVELADFLDTRPDTLVKTKEGKLLPAKIRDFKVRDISLSKPFKPSEYEEATELLRKEFLSNSYKTGKPSPFIRGTPESDIKSAGQIIEKGLGKPIVAEYFKTSTDLKVTKIKDVFPGVDVTLKQDILGAAGKESAVFTRKPPKGLPRLTQKGLKPEFWKTTEEFYVTDPDIEAFGQVRTRVVDKKPSFYYKDNRGLSKLTSPKKDLSFKLSELEKPIEKEKILELFGEVKKVTKPKITVKIEKSGKIPSFLKKSIIVPKSTSFKFSKNVVLPTKSTSKLISTYEIKNNIDGVNVVKLKPKIVKNMNKLISSVEPEFTNNIKQNLKQDLILNYNQKLKQYNISNLSKFNKNSKFFNNLQKSFFKNYNLNLNNIINLKLKDVIKSIYILNLRDNLSKIKNGSKNKQNYIQNEIYKESLKDIYKSKQKINQDLLNDVQFNLKNNLSNFIDDYLDNNLDETLDIPKPDIIKPETKLPKPIIPKIKKTKFYELPKSKTSEKDKIDEKKAYKPYVRTKGKWTEVKTKVPVNFYEAKKRAFEIADKYAERSAKLVPTGKKAKIISRANPFNAFKFRRSKSKNKTKFEWVEKSKFAIDTKGELNDITYKGLKSNKNFL